MKINNISGISRFTRGEGPESERLRDPNISDLPRIGGEPVSSTNHKITTLLAKILGIEGGGKIDDEKAEKS